MASVTDIFNRALAKLGDGRLASASDSSPKARACAGCYDILRQGELSAHPWNFAVQRFQLAASVAQPSFGPYTQYPLPTGWLRVLPPDVTQNFNDRDWIIEGQNLMTTFQAPVNVRCVMDITDTSMMHILFIEALASRMAFEMCEQLTQSNTKKQDLRNDYKMALNEAKKQNAIQKVPQIAVEDTWITCRASGGSVGGGWGAGWGSSG